MMESILREAMPEHLDLNKLIILKASQHGFSKGALLCHKSSGIPRKSNYKVVVEESHCTVTNVWRIS